MTVNYTVVGLQWGDEGKGKIVDLITDYTRVDWVVRFNGGNNAGHTVVRDGKTYKLSLIPTGILTPGVKNFISRGVAFDPQHFIKEIAYLKENGIDVSVPEYPRLRVDEGCPVITPAHRYVDEMQNSSIGTTCRGIGPAYSDYYARSGIRVKDLLLSDAEFRQQFPDHSENTYEMVQSVREQIRPYVVQGFEPDKNENVLFEGAQGMMLDIFHGTYPYVTSSPAHPAFAFVVAGSQRSPTHHIVGVTKAYATRVGNGPFDTELTDGPVAEILSSVGKEVGTVTGRKRRVGWLDLTQLKKSAQIAGVTVLAVTKLDVLDTLDEIQVCVENDTTDGEPRLKYKKFPGWKTSTKGLTDWTQLPLKAQVYIRFIERFVGCHVWLVSTGPESSSMICRV
jgi:adenylosuccinate synthase